MPIVLPMTSGQKEAVRQGTKEAKLIIEDAIGTIKHSMARLSNLIDLEMDKYNELEGGFRDLENTSEMHSRENQKLKAENERLRQELARKR
jgi:hypothetical protein